MRLEPTAKSKRKSKSKRSQIARCIKLNIRNKDIANSLGCSYQYVVNIRNQMKKNGGKLPSSDNMPSVYRRDETKLTTEQLKRKWKGQNSRVQRDNKRLPCKVKKKGNFSPMVGAQPHWQPRTVDWDHIDLMFSVGSKARKI